MRKRLSIITAVIVFLAVLIIAGVWQFNRVLKASSVDDLHYQIESLNVHGVQLSQLSFVYSSQSFPYVVQVRKLHMDWEWQNFIPQLNTLTIEQVVLNGLTRSAKNSAAEAKAVPAAFKLPENWRAPEFLPRQIHIRELVLKQPCAAGVCRITAKADALAEKEKITATLIASPGDQLDSQHQLRMTANYSVENNLPKLNANVVLDKNIDIQLSTHLVKKTEIYWLGKLSGSGSYLDNWWLPHLTSWGIKATPDLNQVNSAVAATLSVESDWQVSLTPLLNMPVNADLAQYSKATTGRWFLDVKIPQPFKIPPLGQFSGQTTVDIEMTAGQLNRYAVSADINAEQLNLPDAWQNFGISADKLHINLHSKVEAGASLAALPIEFFGDSQGNLAGKFSGHMVADVFAKKIIVDRFLLTAKANQLKPYADDELKNINVNLQAVGYWQPESFSFNLTEPGQISADANIKSLTLIAKSVRIIANKFSVAGKVVQGAVVWPELAIDSDAIISVDKLSHAQLKENSWRWQGKAKGFVSNLDVKGDLSIGSAFSMNHSVSVKSLQLNVEWKLADIFLLAANPFADTLRAWPPLLSLARGKLDAHGSFEFDLENKSLKKSNSFLNVQDVAGIYDTTAFDGINTKATINTADNHLKIVTNDIKVNQVNKGFIFGPLQAAGNYQATWEKPTEGKLALEYFNGVVVQGKVSTPKQDFDFSRPEQKLVVTLHQLNLTSLLQQYPTSELSGSGQLSGSIPIEISKKGIRISKGTVAAESPGGKLKYQSARATELAKSQPSMKLLTEALNDFQYSVLVSEVNYDETGKLLLSVRLEGKNPKLEKGRPINFNINFEEDIPAMLASIQLSSKVNDVIKKRLQEYLQRKPESTVISIKK
ncbi:YdbH domain-containing protein [Cellvibrio zantedeschiae]|nr:YdbH domain-containing protein [Cellvibrio zantedeschiae]